MASDCWVPQEEVRLYLDDSRSLAQAITEGREGAVAPGSMERLQRVLASFDLDLCQQILDQLATNGTCLVPTHGTREMDVRVHDHANLDATMSRLTGSDQL